MVLLWFLSTASDLLSVAMVVVLVAVVVVAVPSGFVAVVAMERIAAVSVTISAAAFTSDCESPDFRGFSE